MKFYLLIFLQFIFVFVNAQSFMPIDKDSKLHFVIKNFGINTGGDIAGMKGKMNFDAKKPATSSFDVTADVVTINTDNEKRDDHLKSDDYFNAQKFSTIHLVSKAILPGADLKHFTFKGLLTIKDVTKTIEFPFVAEGKEGGALFTGEFEINRIEFGVGKESFSLSNKVKIKLSVFAKQL